MLSLAYDQVIIDYTYVFIGGAFFLQFGKLLTFASDGVFQVSAKHATAEIP